MADSVAEQASVAGSATPTLSNADWFARAQRVIPGGVDSPVRSFASVGGTPYTVVQGEGPYVVDAEGTRYIDMVQSYGAVLLGHAHPVVTAAIANAAARRTTRSARQQRSGTARKRLHTRLQSVAAMSGEGQFFLGSRSM